VAIAAICLCPAAWAGGGDPGSFGFEAWKAEIERKGLDPEEVIFPFTASEEMVAWAGGVLASGSGEKPDEQLRLLQEAMFDEESFEFVYDGEMTLTAEEAFDTRRGNCMSFTGLFIALSRGVGIPTFLMSVQKTPEVDREGALVVINRHVVAGHREGRHVSTFDFYLTSDVPYTGKQVVDDVMASAMFHTNLGGKFLRAGESSPARAHLEIATVLAPQWAPGWVNLGVALARLGDTDGAFDAYRRALEADPMNSSAFINMSHLYRALGHEHESQVALRAAARSTESPFTLIVTADAEALAGNFREASRYLKRAKRRYPDEPEVYHAMARLARREGDDRRAEKHEAKAAKVRERAESPR
jgi:Flp pilus assembly protein TadD